ncbi:MAG TPA: hypothetical protein VMI54_00095 [Polyangiaceae bacterium]|nr:hypothetical protein [Polyangiaceae bacterium]
MPSARLVARLLLVSGTLGACAGSGAAFETVTTLPRPARHPAGADLEPETTLPEPERHGTTADGVVVLETPADPNAARAVVAAFFRAVVDESPHALNAVLAENAHMLSGSRREAALSVWSGRFARFDYRSLGGEPLYRDSDVQVTEEERDLLVRVPLGVAWGSRPRMLGDEFTFRLVPSGAGFLIDEIVEDYRSP